jgi:hypothetical protein
MSEPIDLAKALAQAVMQEAAFDVGDLVNRYPVELRPYLMVVVKSIHDSVVAGFSDDEHQLYESLLSRTVMMTMPKSMDPREKGGRRDE